MSHSNCIKSLLDIQDPNITFDEDCVKEGTYKGKRCKYISGKLSYTPTHCGQCGVKNTNFTVYKNGTQLSRFTLPITGVNPTYLLLQKQRFMCQACQSSFTAKTPIVQMNCFISQNVKAQVTLKSAEAQSLTSIARDCSVSPTTVQRQINEAAKQFIPHYKALLKHLSFDEFKYAKDAIAFEYINAESGNILDILDRRDNFTIKNHFIVNYSLTDRKRVETVTIDMNAGYVSVIKELFPNAKIIIDRFHLVQLINRSMNKCRIQVMNQLKTSSGDDMKKYRRLKRYWKLLLKKHSDLSSVEYKYYSLFGQRTGQSIVDEMLEYDPALKENYELYQELMESISNKDFGALSSCLTNPVPSAISNYMRTSLKTLRKHLPFLENSFIYPYNNGRIEGNNNKIKVLNRVAYGYRNFQNYRKRILLHFRLKPSVKQQEQGQFHFDAA
ncbi:ISL3 family transposase [Sporosarcina sp. FSL K6-1508]|uniref:ISL3 family transposase n=1 Tax=Sporosarcina sp. FSL K6-1508 TaxID=2921553 RepID=UPI0030F9A5AE